VALLGKAEAHRREGERWRDLTVSDQLRKNEFVREIHNRVPGHPTILSEEHHDSWL